MSFCSRRKPKTVCFNDPVSCNDWWALVSTHYGMILCLLCGIYTVAHKLTFVLIGGKLESLFHVEGIEGVNSLKGISGRQLQDVWQNRDIWHVPWFFSNFLSKRYITVAVCERKFILQKRCSKHFTKVRKGGILNDSDGNTEVGIDASLSSNGFWVFKKAVCIFLCPKLLLQSHSKYCRAGFTAMKNHCFYFVSN